jgi:nicotinate phosphoribosyltransferase
MAHALVMALAALEGGEDESFAAFHRYFPGAALLIDTYDTVAAAERLAKQVRSGQMTVKAVRLDSGDLVSLSQQVRHLLPDVFVVASGDLDEYEIDRLQAAGSSIDGYGLGTKLVSGTPVNGVYKLVEIDQIPVLKASSGKQTYPGRKQIFRRYQREQLAGDRLGLMSESPQPSETPLLQLVIKQGTRLQPAESLSTIAERTRISVTGLPPAIRRIRQPATLQPELSVDLQTLTDQTQAQIQKRL